eukprot:12006752-Alexandrium_andersonii.AAC.1
MGTRWDRTWGNLLGQGRFFGPEYNEQVAEGLHRKRLRGQQARSKAERLLAWKRDLRGDGQKRGRWFQRRWARVHPL